MVSNFSRPADRCVITAKNIRVDAKTIYKSSLVEDKVEHVVDVDSARVQMSPLRRPHLLIPLAPQVHFCFLPFRRSRVGPPPAPSTSTRVPKTGPLHDQTKPCGRHLSQFPDRLPRLWGN